MESPRAFQAFVREELEAARSMLTQLGLAR